jgi:GNAT superfamily N-acetyltransferase
VQLRLVPFTREEHLDATVAALLRVRESDPSYPPPVDVEAGEESFGDWLLADEVESRWAATVDGRVVGHVAVSLPHDYILRFLSTSTESAPPADRLREVVKLFVDPTARRKGTGEALLSRAVTAIREQQRVPVLAVVSSSEAARRLYARNALTELGTFDGVHGRNHVFLGTATPAESSTE